MAITISGTTGVAGVDGSASAPATTGTDSNSGIFYGADVIKFSTGGTERMSISNSGATGTGLGGLFASYAVICDKKAYDEEGGTFTAGAWRTRDLNHEIRDEDGIVSIGSNQFTLQAGDYFVRWTCPAENVNRHSTRLYNVTDSSIVFAGTAQFLSNGASTEITGTVEGAGYINISGAKAFEIQHYGQTTSSNMGFGMKSNVSGVDSIYTIVEILKES
tara:strand:+ start:101 stop:754 length:654 start_codon:yes stop_codon:yes gene_type:complete